MQECPGPVLELISHLGQSGTGKSKLNKLMELGCKCSGAEEFLAKAAKVVPPGTMAKINTYVASQEAQGKEPMVPSTPDSVTTSSPEEVKDTKSEVADFNAPEAIAHIGNMRSIDKLEHIILTDSRVTVQRAAEERIKHLIENA